MTFVRPERLAGALVAVGLELTRAFPRGAGDRDELPNALSRDGRPEANEE